MVKKLLCAGLICCMFHTPVHAIFGFQVPTEFTLRTTFQVRNVCQAALGLASVSMFYKAFDTWSQADLVNPANAQEMQLQGAAIQDIKQQRKKAAIKYLISGNIFAAAALCIPLGHMLLKKFFRN